jgi:hypothetical protein
MKTLVPCLEELAARGGSMEMIVGLDLKTTTHQGLDLARRHARTVHVVHDPEGRTFHPKLYLAVGRDRAYALVGSNNLAAGGMGFNYEGAIALTFDPRRERALLREFRRYADNLKADTAVCRKLTATVHRRLNEESWLADEDVGGRREDQPGTARSGNRGGKPPLFRSSSVRKRSTKPPPRKRSVAKRSRRKGATSAVALDSWSKQLNSSDAQRPPAGHPTFVVRLTAPTNAPDRPRFFRRSFFADETWRRTQDTNGNQLYLAEIEVEASIDGKSLGQKKVTVDYGPHRNEKGRATTVLHWGDLLPAVMKKNVTGRYLLIERAHGSYSLTISTKKPT